MKRYYYVTKDHFTRLAGFYFLLEDKYFFSLALKVKHFFPLRQPEHQSEMKPQLMTEISAIW
jgi:hypothetical protein